jgi:hypothetical protein
MTPDGPVDVWNDIVFLDEERTVSVISTEGFLNRDHVFILGERYARPG